MARQVEYKFEEMPLLIECGIQAGLINGSALLNYWPDGQWGVSEIYLDGFINNPNAPRGFEWRSLRLDRGTPLHSMIWDRLENEWRADVQERVNETIGAEQEEFA